MITYIEGFYFCFMYVHAYAHMHMYHPPKKKFEGETFHFSVFWFTLPVCGVPQGGRESLIQVDFWPALQMTRLCEGPTPLGTHWSGRFSSHLPLPLLALKSLTTTTWIEMIILKVVILMWGADARTHLHSHSVVL